VAKDIGAVCRRCRRENLKLYLKGDRCYSDKCSFERRAFGPGQHGQARFKKVSDYALQLREKQKVKNMYIFQIVDFGFFRGVLPLLILCNCVLIRAESFLLSVSRRSHLCWIFI